MKLKILAVHLATHLDQQASTFVELHRALREGFTAAYAEPLPPDLLDRDAMELLGSAAQKLTGKSGPGGGIAADPLVVTLLAIASIIDSTRAEVAVKTMEVFAATPTESERCPLTGKRFFGWALAAILTDPNIVFEIDQVEVSHDAGEMLIINRDVVLSRFNRPEIRFPPRATHFVGRITFYGLFRLHQFIRGNPDFNFAEKLEAQSRAKTEAA